MSKLENDFQANVIKEIKQRLPESMVLKNDANYIQGIPDLMILYKDRWASLECKKDKNSPYQPNQEGYISQMNEMSFSSVIYPENKEEVLDALQRSLQSRRTTRVSRRK